MQINSKKDSALYSSCSNTKSCRVSPNILYRGHPALCWYVCCQVVLSGHPLWLLYLYLYSMRGLALMPLPICLLNSFSWLKWINSAVFTELFDTFLSILEPSDQSLVWISVLFIISVVFAILSGALSIFTHSPIHHLMSTADFFHSLKIQRCLFCQPNTSTQHFPSILSYLRGRLVDVWWLFPDSEYLSSNLSCDCVEVFKEGKVTGVKGNPEHSPLLNVATIS